MAIEIINEEPYIRSFWDTEARCYVNEWHGLIGKDDFKKAVMIGFDFMMKNKVRVHIADAGDMRTGWTGSEEWLHEHFWPEIHKNGLTHFGIILPRNAFIEFASQQMKAQMAERGIHIEYEAFESMESALEWSKKVQKI